MTQTVPPAPATLPESELNRRVIVSLYRALKAGDINAVVALLDPEVVLVEADSLPAPGIHRGRDAFLQAAAVMLKHLDVSDGAVDALLADGDAVMALARARWRRADGQSVDIRIAEYWRLRDGKVIECQPYYGDTAAMLADRR